jgi:hypothetical protein
MFIPDPDLDFFIHPGSRIQGSKRHRIPDPQHCIEAVLTQLHFDVCLLCLDQDNTYILRDSQGNVFKSSKTIAGTAGQTCSS